MGSGSHPLHAEGKHSAYSAEPWAVLTLFVTDSSPSSTRARQQLRDWLSMPPPGEVSLEVVDVLEHPDRAAAERVLATPTLIRHRPLPRRKIVGDLSEWDRVSLALDLGVGP